MRSAVETAIPRSEPLIFEDKTMKKAIGIATLCLALGLAPMTASARSHHHHDGRLIVGVGAGVAAGAVVAGPVGAVVGGLIGLIIVHH